MAGHFAAIRLHNLSLCETIVSAWVTLTGNQQKWKKKVKTHKVHLGPGRTAVSLSTPYLETDTNTTSKLEKRGNYSDKSGRSQHLVWFTQRIPSIFIFTLAEELYIQLSSEMYYAPKQSNLGSVL